mmetsp:Transcript_26387/g.42316  ORF Transcript_26387/g.42316 Transcript_26387/m.42316 type:complete len:584 (-) Transcript_26387:54-1805(-)
MSVLWNAGASIDAPALSSESPPLKPMDILGKNYVKYSAPGTPMSQATTAPSTPMLDCSSEPFIMTRLVSESASSFCESEDHDEFGDDSPTLEGKSLTLEGKSIDDMLAEVKDMYAAKSNGFGSCWLSLVREASCEDLVDLVDDDDDEHDDEIQWVQSTAQAPPGTNHSTGIEAINEEDSSPCGDDDMLWMHALGGLVDCDGPDEVYPESVHQDHTSSWMHALDGMMDLHLDSSDPVAGGEEQGITEPGITSCPDSEKEALQEEPAYIDPQEKELAMLDVEPTPRYDASDSTWLEHLDEHGFVVIANVASGLELSHAEDLLWEFLEGCSDWKRHEPDTWDDEGLQNIGSCMHGIIRRGGIGQSDFMWYLRTLPLVRSTFARIWGTDELLSSFDGACVFRPWHHGFRKTAAGWWHVDQGAAKKGRQAVQGFISLFEGSGKTGGLTVIPDSHLYFDEFIQGQKDPQQDFYPIPHNSPMLQEHSRKLLCCRPGDLVLWDARTIHASAPAPLPPETPIHQLLRAVAYICMTPKIFATDEVLALRRIAYEYNETCTHWPQKIDIDMPGQDKPRHRSLSNASPAVVALVG